MTKQRRKLSGEEGFTLVYMAAGLTTFLLFTGLALDSGRAYVVKAQLSKAVDGAALGAARNLNTGNPRAEAARIFNANFPTGWFGTTSVTMIRSGPAPWARAASTNSFSRSDSTSPRTGLAM